MILTVASTVVGVDMANYSFKKHSTEKLGIDLLVATMLQIYSNIYIQVADFKNHVP